MSSPDTDHRSRCWVGRFSGGEWVPGWVDLHKVPSLLPAIIYLADPSLPAGLPASCPEGRPLNVREGRGNDRLSTPTFHLLFWRRRSAAVGPGMVGRSRSLGRSVPRSRIQCMQSRPTLSLSLSPSHPRGLDFATRDPLFPPSLPLAPSQRSAIRRPSAEPLFTKDRAGHVRSQDYSRNQPLISSSCTAQRNIEFPSSHTRGGVTFRKV